MTSQPGDLFEALAQSLRERIRAGELAPGALLPSESELARAAGTKRYSIRKALALLRDEGLINPVPGRGWAVTSALAAPEHFRCRGKAAEPDVWASCGDV